MKQSDILKFANIINDGLDKEAGLWDGLAGDALRAGARRVGTAGFNAADAIGAAGSKFMGGVRSQVRGATDAMGRAVSFGQAAGNKLLGAGQKAWQLGQTTIHLPTPGIGAAARQGWQAGRAAQFNLNGPGVARAAAGGWRDADLAMQQAGNTERGLTTTNRGWTGGPKPPPIVEPEVLPATEGPQRPPSPQVSAPMPQGAMVPFKQPHVWNQGPAIDVTPSSAMTTTNRGWTGGPGGVGGPVPGSQTSGYADRAKQWWAQRTTPQKLGLGYGATTAATLPSNINNNAHADWQQQHPILSWGAQTFGGMPKYNPHTYLLPSFLQH